MHEVSQFFGLLPVFPNPISISSPSLLCHGVVAITITLKAWQRPETLDSGMGFRAIDIIETCTFHLNVSYYHRIDEVTLTDTRHGQMMFLTKLTD